MTNDELKSTVEKLEKVADKMHEAYHGLSEGQAKQNKDIEFLCKEVSEVRRGMWGAEGDGGFLGRVTEVEKTQSRHKGYIAVASVISALVGRFLPR